MSDACLGIMLHLSWATDCVEIFLEGLGRSTRDTSFDIPLSGVSRVGARMEWGFSNYTCYLSPPEKHLQERHIV